MTERLRMSVERRRRKGSRTSRDRCRAVRRVQLKAKTEAVSIDSDDGERFFNLLRGAMAVFGGGGKYGTSRC